MRTTPSPRPRAVRARLAAGLGAAALLAAPAVAAAQTGTAEVVVVHGVPDLVVDILIDGEVAIEAMEFADAPVVTTLPEGDAEIVVAATGTTDPVLSLDATLTSGTSVTVAAHLDPLGAPKLAAYENRTTMAGIQPFHLADFGAVDVLAGTEVLLAGVLDGQTARIDLPEGATVADVGIRATGTSEIAIDLGTLTVAADELLLVYAIGPDTGETLPTIVTARVDAVEVGAIGAGEAGTAADGRNARSAGAEDAVHRAVFGDVHAVAEDVLGARSDAAGAASGDGGPAAPPGSRVRRDVAAALARAARGTVLDDREALLLLTTTGVELEALARTADEVRAERVGDVVTYVVNRNINATNVCYVGCRFCAFAQRRDDPDAYSLSLEEVADRAEEAWRDGATEVCIQSGIHPDLPGDHALAVLNAVLARVPDLHVHAFSPMEVVMGATRLGIGVREWLEEARRHGLGSIPGTAAEILDDEVRWVLTKGKLPAAQWVEVVTTAHALGIPSTSTMMYGHVDEPRHWVAHLKLLRRIQEDTGGFTEFVPLPFVHQLAPIYLAGVARPGSTFEEDRRIHALARLLLAGAIDHVQLSWVKLGLGAAGPLLTGGCDDLGGTLMEETISRMAGSTHGVRQTPEALEAAAAVVGRPARQRLTDYSPAPPRRVPSLAGAPGASSTTSTDTLT